MASSNFIILIMVCTPVLAVVQAGKFSGRKVLTAEFLDEMGQAYKMEVWDTSLQLVLNELLSESFKLSQPDHNGCCVFALKTQLGNGLFEIKKCTAAYDQNQGYSFVIALMKGARLTIDSAPFIPNAELVISYMKEKGITVEPKLWGIGYRHKMYVPFPITYNLQKIVNVSDVREVQTREQGLKDVIDVYAICGVKSSGQIKMTFWGEHAHKMKSIISQYCKNGCDEPVVMWSSLNLYEPASSCYLQRSSDGSLTIATKKTVINFTPPRLVSTATEVDDFIKLQKLSPMADWKSDSLEAMTPSAGRSPSLITSPPSTVVAFNSADFLQRQQRRLMLDKGLAIDLTLESDESSLAQNLSVEAGVVDNADPTPVTDSWSATIVEAAVPDSSPAAIVEEIKESSCQLEDPVAHVVEGFARAIATVSKKGPAMKRSRLRSCLRMNVRATTYKSKRLRLRK